jgi:hypothetical protein
MLEDAFLSTVIYCVKGVLLQRHPFVEQVLSDCQDPCWLSSKQP